MTQTFTSFIHRFEPQSSLSSKSSQIIWRTRYLRFTVDLTSVGAPRPTISWRLNTCWRRMRKHPRVGFIDRRRTRPIISDKNDQVTITRNRTNNFHIHFSANFLQETPSQRSAYTGFLPINGMELRVALRRSERRKWESRDILQKHEKRSDCFSKIKESNERR